ncbi:MAG: DNA pilot protein [Microvirus sp.]|nr:MAG: DNA pilot protein [Microvirus sp.]
MSAAWGAVAEVAGGLASSAININQARVSRSWQERMSNTAHQREINDLKLAGLNPILSGMGGSGASVSTGQSARVDNAASGMASAGVARERLSDIERESLKLAQATNVANIREIESRVAVNEQEARLRGFQADYAGKQAESNIGVQGSQTDLNVATAENVRLKRGEIELQNQIAKILSGVLEYITRGETAPGGMMRQAVNRIATAFGAPVDVANGWLKDAASKYGSDARKVEAYVVAKAKAFYDLYGSGSFGQFLKAGESPPADSNAKSPGGMYKSH